MVLGNPVKGSVNPKGVRTTLKSVSTQARGPKFGSLEPNKKAGIAREICNPSAWTQRQGHLWSSKARRPSEHQVQCETPLKTGGHED